MLRGESIKTEKEVKKKGWKLRDGEEGRVKKDGTEERERSNR